MLRRMLLVLGLGLGGLTQAEIKHDLRPENTVLLDSYVGSGMPLLGRTLLLESSKNDVLNIIINSPGGSVSYGEQFISTLHAIRDSGIVIRCYVTGMAASMAFSILLECSERYAYPEAQLLWHQARVSLGSSPASSNELREYAVELEVLDADILKRVKEELVGFDPADLFYRFMNSRFITAALLITKSPKFLVITPHLPDLKRVLLNAPSLDVIQSQFSFFNSAPKPASKPAEPKPAKPELPDSAPEFEY